MFGTIIVATDFSPCAARAVRVAAAWAGALDATLDVVHVFDLPVQAVPHGGPWLSPEIALRHGRELGERLEHVVDAARASASRTSGVLLRGRPYDAIARHAAARRAELVVVGAHGLGMLERALFGSVADRVVRTAPCSVLVVPEHDRPELLPKTMVVPTDFSTRATHTVERALDLARTLGARVEILHAWEWPRGAPRQGGLAEDIAGAALARVRAAHPSAAGVEVHHHAHEAAPADAILALAAQTHADLVVMAPSGERDLPARLLGSVTERVVRSALVPVLVLRDAQP